MERMLEDFCLRIPTNQEKNANFQCSLTLTVNLWMCGEKMAFQAASGSARHPWEPPRNKTSKSSNLKSGTTQLKFFTTLFYLYTQPLSSSFQCKVKPKVKPSFLPSSNFQWQWAESNTKCQDGWGNTGLWLAELKIAVAKRKWAGQGRAAPVGRVFEMNNSQWLACFSLFPVGVC